MKIAAHAAMGDFARRLKQLQEGIEAAALDAAAEALAEELAHVRERSGLRAPLVSAGAARRRSVGANDPQSLAREFGSPSEPPAPWLAPALPGAPAPMRAAALARVRDVVAAHAGKPGAVARALSRKR